MKTPTQWTTNPNKNVDVTKYSDATVLYSSAAQRYVSSMVGLNELNKPQTAWTSLTKTATSWVVNPDFNTNQYVYDSAILYDSTRTYDGINGNESSITTVAPTAWTAV